MANKLVIAENSDNKYQIYYKDHNSWSMSDRIFEIYCGYGEPIWEGKSPSEAKVVCEYANKYPEKIISFSEQKALVDYLKRQALKKHDRAFLTMNNTLSIDKHKPKCRRLSKV